MVAWHLQVAVDDHTVERVTVGMGHVVRTQTERRAAEEARHGRNAQQHGRTALLQAFDQIARLALLEPATAWRWRRVRERVGG